MTVNTTAPVTTAATTAITLPEVQELLDAQSKGVWDTLLEPQDITLAQGRVISPRLYRYEYPQGLTPTNWATGQLCQFLGVPTAYFRKCPASLQDAQANYWLQNLIEEQAKDKAEKAGRNGRNGNNNGRAEQWLLRARGETLRGVLTDRYTRLDHLELFEAVSPALSKDYQVDWFALNDESFHLRLHDNRLYRDALPNDRLMAGVHIANSEVGKRAVTVDALIYRLVCTNGLIRKVGGASLLHQRHIALSRPEFKLTVQQAVRDALAQSASYLDRLAVSVAHPIPDVERAIHKIALDWGLTQATEEAVKKAMLLEVPSQHETLYGLINGLTSVARSMGPDERYALEASAGQLLEDRLSRSSREPAGSVGSVVPPVFASAYQSAPTSDNGCVAIIASKGGNGSSGNGSSGNGNGSSGDGGLFAF